MASRESLERFLKVCRISRYKVKDQAVVPGFSQRSIYTLVHGADTLEVYETVSPLVIVSLKGSSFPFAAALVLALETRFGKAQLVYLDRLGEELQDVTAYYCPLTLSEADRQAFVRQHRALGFSATVIDTAELEKAAAGYLV